MIRKAFTFVGDCFFAFGLFVEYIVLAIAGLSWCVLAMPAHAGGCYSCQQAYVQREVSYVPQTIIEHQNNEIFYSVGAGARDYALSQQNVAAASAGQVERQISALQTQLASYRQQAQPVPAQLVYAVPVQAVAAPVCVPAQAQAAYCPPGQQPPMPAQAMASPVPLQPAAARPDGIVEQRCVKCHSGPNPKGKFDITGKIDCNMATLAIQKVIDGKMPRDDTRFTDAEIVKLSAELLGAKPAAKSEDDGNY